MLCYHRAQCEIMSVTSVTNGRGLKGISYIWNININKWSLYMYIMGNSIFSKRRCMKIFRGEVVRFCHGHLLAYTRPLYICEGIVYAAGLGNPHMLLAVTLRGHVV